MKVRIEMEVEFDVYATDEEIQEFCQFQFAEWGGCNRNNPLLDAGYEVTYLDCEKD